MEKIEDTKLWPRSNMASGFYNVDRYGESYLARCRTCKKRPAKVEWAGTYHCIPCWESVDWEKVKREAAA